MILESNIFFTDMGKKSQAKKLNCNENWKGNLI